MIRAKPDDSVRPRADALAQIILQCASDDPTLVRHSGGHAKSAQIQAKLLPAAQHEFGSPLTLLSNSDQATRQYREDLVSIAVASAERADAVLNQANATRRKANPAMWAFASVAGRNTHSQRSQPGPLGVGSSRRYHDSSSSRTAPAADEHQKDRAHAKQAFRRRIEAKMSTPAGDDTSVLMLIDNPVP